MHSLTTSSLTRNMANNLRKIIALPFRTWKFAAFACFLGALFMLGGTQDAFARGGSTLVGTSYFGNQRNCFDEHWRGVRNQCSGTRTWVLPAIYDNAGNMTMHVSARGLSGTARRVCCRAWSVSSAGGSVRNGARECTTRHDGVAQWLRSSVSAHGWGSTVAFCEMDSGTAMFTYHY